MSSHNPSRVRRALAVLAALGAVSCSSPHHVGACDGLGPPNQWEDITPPMVDRSKAGGVLSVQTDALNGGTLYTGTDHQGLWRSVDCGAHWIKANTGANGDNLDSGSLWVLRTDPTDSNVLYAGSLYGHDPSLQKSTDRGTSWHSLAPPGSEIAMTVDYNFFQDIGIDRGDSQHLVVSFHAPCNGSLAPTCLAESLDGGDNWRLFKGPTGGWEERAGLVVLGKDRFLFHTWANGTYLTETDGAQWEKVMPGNNFEVYRNSDGFDYLGSYSGLYRSMDGRTWSKVEGAPDIDALVGDGKTLFGVRGGDFKAQYVTAAASDPTKWTEFPAPPGTPQPPHRIAWFAFDADHHVLFAASTNDGLWRMVTK
jgi:hypothetical protein